MYAVLDAYKFWIAMGFGFIAITAIYEFITEK